MNKDIINEFASFDEYLRQGEPSQKESAENWKTAIGLQAVDGLQPSAYLIDVAKRNIEGEITLDETRKLIDSYYQSKTICISSRLMIGKSSQEQVPHKYPASYPQVPHKYPTSSVNMWRLLFYPLTMNI